MLSTNQNYRLTEVSDLDRFLTQTDSRHAQQTVVLCYFKDIFSTHSDVFLNFAHQLQNLDLCVSASKNRCWQLHSSSRKTHTKTDMRPTNPLPPPLVAIIAMKLFPSHQCVSLPNCPNYAKPITHSHPSNTWQLWTALYKWIHGPSLHTL